MQEDRELLTVGGSYLKVFVINGEYKLYGQSHIIYHHLGLTLSFQEYLKAPYISLTIEKVGKGFVWFWYALNGLAPYPVDEYWNRMTLRERLDTWPHIKAHLPGMFEWYYDNLFTAITPVRDESLLPILEDIVRTIPSNLQLPKNNLISSFNEGYHIVTSLPYPILEYLKLINTVEGKSEPLGESYEESAIMVIHLDHQPTRIYRHIVGEGGWVRESIPDDLVAAMGVDPNEDDLEENAHALVKPLLEGGDESGGVIMLIHVKEQWYLYDENENESKMLPVARFVVYTGTLDERREIRPVCQPVSRDYIDHIYYSIGVGDTTLHGDLLVMRKRSPFIANLDIATERITLLEGKKGILPLILPIWEWMNGRETCALPVPESWGLISYFGISFDSSFVEQYIYDLLTHAKRGWDRGLYLQLLSILNTIPKAYLPTYRVTEGKQNRATVGENFGITTLADEILSTIWVPGDQIFSLQYKGYTDVTKEGVSHSRDIAVVWYLEGSSRKTFPVFLQMVSFDLTSRLALYRFEDVRIKYERGAWHAYRDKSYVSSVITIIRPPPRKFKYERADIALDNERKHVTSASFHTVMSYRYDIFKDEVIEFLQPLTELEAVEAVEEYLSAPMTREYIAANLSTEEQMLKAYEGLPRGELIVNPRMESIHVLGGMLDIKIED